MSNKVEFVNPIPYHKVIEELSDIIFEKFVNDDRSNDSFLEKPSLQEFIKTFEENKDSWKSSSELEQMIIRSQGLYLIAELICQTSVFGRIIMEKEEWVNNELIKLPTYPKNKLPMKYKQTTDDGKPVDYSEIHSLQLMKSWYKKKKGQLKEFLTPNK